MVYKSIMKSVRYPALGNSELGNTAEIPVLDAQNKAIQYVPNQAIQKDR